MIAATSRIVDLLLAFIISVITPSSASSQPRTASFRKQVVCTSQTSDFADANVGDFAPTRFSLSGRPDRSIFSLLRLRAFAPRSHSYRSRSIACCRSCRCGSNEQKHIGDAFALRHNGLAAALHVHEVSRKIRTRLAFSTFSKFATSRPCKF